MGADDDADCVGHVWEMTELRLSLVHGAEQVQVCLRPNCEAVQYVQDPTRQDRKRRPKL